MLLKNLQTYIHTTNLTNKTNSNESIKKRNTIFSIKYFTNKFFFLIYLITPQRNKSNVRFDIRYIDGRQKNACRAVALQTQFPIPSEKSIRTKFNFLVRAMFRILTFSSSFSSSFNYFFLITNSYVIHLEFL